MDDYDVFLSHRGPDVKAGFMAHLEEALRRAGLNPFLDKTSLKKGKHAFQAIDRALEVARVHVAVVSRRYAESKHCLNELVAMLGSGKTVIPVFYNVEPAELRRVDRGVFRAAFKKHRSRETEERVQEWADALCKLAGITAFVFRSSDYQGNEVELKQKVVDVVVSSLPSPFALQVESHLVGLDEHVQTCVKEVEKMSSAIGCLGLVGMGGIGKTLLAKKIYNHFVGKKTFQATSFLDCNSPTRMEVGSSLLSRLQKQLLWDLLRIGESNQPWSYDYWFPKISSLGRVLIVLDDIYDKVQFDKLIPFVGVLAPGSCIIVTSRDRHVLKLIGGQTNFYLYEVTLLGCEDSEKLFNWHAFGDEEAPNTFKDVANAVSKACGGLPLALKVVGSSLSDKISDEDRKCIWPEAIDALKEGEGIKGALKWSYDCLLESERLMFVDIACIFCGWEKQQALEIWQSCKKCTSCCRIGTPYTSLRHLVDKSLVTLEKHTSRDVLAMHGLLRDMGEGIGDVDGSHLWEGKGVKVLEQRIQKSNKVRAMSLVNGGRYSFDVKNFEEMHNLHYLILDECDVDGNLGSIAKELRYLRWRHMPQTHIPSMQKFSNLVSLDFSKSTKLANIWIESDTTLEGCPNLLRLDLSECTSITTLPESIGHLSRLQLLDIRQCRNLQKLPTSIGQLTALEEFRIGQCGSLEALPDSITSLSRLHVFYLDDCTSLSKLPATFGLMTGLKDLGMNLATEQQAFDIGQLNVLKKLGVFRCTDEAITALDSSGALTNLHQLDALDILNSPSMTKLPETMGRLSNLNRLSILNCEKLRELPNSIGQLKVLDLLELRYCRSLKTLPDSLGALTSLTGLFLVKCTSITELPSSVGHLSSLRWLHMEGCGAMQSLPDSLSQLNALVRLEIFDCGSSLEGLGLLRALQGLRIWGCTFIDTQLPGSCLVVVDSSNRANPAIIWDYEGIMLRPREVKEVGEVEANDCGRLRHVREDGERGRAILQRVHSSSCCKGVTRVYKRRRLSDHGR